MATQRKSMRKPIGRGRREQDPNEKLLQEVAVTRKRSLAAWYDHKTACRKARMAGIELPQKSSSEPTIEIWGRIIHIFDGDLEHPQHRHTVVSLPKSLSPECLAELAEKITDGRVSYNRVQGEKHGWQNHVPIGNSLETERAAD